MGESLGAAEVIAEGQVDDAVGLLGTGTDDVEIGQRASQGGAAC
ncbi:MAG: hypothetical protein ABWX74_10240 [Aeromicrobium sp.]